MQDMVPVKQPAPAIASLWDSQNQTKQPPLLCYLGRSPLRCPVYHGLMHLNIPNEQNNNLMMALLAHYKQSMLNYDWLDIPDE